MSPAYLLERNLLLEQLQENNLRRQTKQLQKVFAKSCQGEYAQIEDGEDLGLFGDIWKVRNILDSQSEMG